MDFYSKDNYSLEDIKYLIDNEVEENIHLDYKAAGALSKEPGKKREITKDVSAFANSDGGIIVYGVSEDGILPKEIGPIDGKVYTKEWLENIIQSIQPRIDNVKIYPIRINAKDQYVYLVKIPRSDNAPHMAQDNRYYKRINFQSEPMEDYEVRDTYNRVTIPRLVIEGCAFYQIRDDNETVTFKARATILNIGHQVCELYKLNFYINNAPCGVYSHETIDIRDIYTVMDNNRVKISFRARFPIFPDERIDIGDFLVTVKKEFASIFEDNLVLNIILCYKGGKDELAFMPRTKEFVRGRENIERLIRERHLDNIIPFQE